MAGEVAGVLGRLSFEVGPPVADTKGACKPMTRIAAVAHEVPILGTGSLVTHSLIAARTFPAAYADEPCHGLDIERAIAAAGAGQKLSAIDCR